MTPSQYLCSMNILVQETFKDEFAYQVWGNKLSLALGEEEEEDEEEDEEGQKSEEEEKEEEEEEEEEEEVEELRRRREL